MQKNGFLECWWVANQSETNGLVKQFVDGVSELQVGWCFWKPQEDMRKLLVKNAAHSLMGLELLYYQVLPLTNCRARFHLNSQSLKLRGRNRRA